MLANIGIPGLILILLLALIIFGPNKLPQIGKAAGQTLREFKKSAKDLTSGATDEINEVKSVINNENTK